MDYRKIFSQWKTDDSILEEYRKELSLLTDEKDIEDRFYRELEFGTAGLRGILGAGTNRMNEHTVGKAAEGFSRYLKKKYVSAKVAVAYDSRIKSPEFAKISARILASGGHHVFLYDSLRPVPLLSFAVRDLKCQGGIVITASHNPKEYNGFKVYSGYGGQVTDDEAKMILEEIGNIKSYSEIKAMDYDEAVKEGLISIIGKEVDDKYRTLMEGLTVRKSMVKDYAPELKIIYTPLHGSGLKPVTGLLTSLGYEDLTVVKEQAEPDGTFPTAPYPNPENPEVFELALKLKEKIGADIIFATDPDADRIGLIVTEGAGNNRVLTGNQTGMLLTHYLLMSLAEEGKLPDDAAVIKTVVSTDSVKKICDSYNTTLFDVLTGFKYIGEKIEEFIEKKSHTFIFGFEESYGYLVGDYVRDKDAVVTSMMVCEMALYYKLKGMNLWDALISVYEKYGFFEEGIISYTKKGIEGAALIIRSMDFFRNLELKEIMGSPAVKKIDYLTGMIHDLKTGTVSATDLPSSNVIKFMAEDDSWFVIRPSGTEPKMKAYMAVKGNTLEDAEIKNASFREYVDMLVKKSFGETE